MAKSTGERHFLTEMQSKMISLLFFVFCASEVGTHEKWFEQNF